jgi:two-component system NtrC family sensor kinase
VRTSSYETKDVDMHDLMDKTIELIAFQGRLRDVEVMKNYTESPLQLYGSEGELKQAILAILTNALDAMQERGTLRIATEIRENDAFISIGDTGPGIAQEHIKRIFDPFFSLKSASGGTGLGLSIANRIISNHHGRITVDSDAGKGATFAIMLPLKGGSTPPRDITAG